MKTIRPMTLALGAFVLVLANTAHADARGPGARMLPGFEQLDTNQSGTFTLEDFQAQLEMRGPAGRQDQVIARLMQQANEDGKLTEDALRAGFSEMMEERRQRMGDRAPKEGADMGTRLFSRMDANGDGAVSAEEYDAFTNRMSQRMHRMNRDSDGRGKRWGRGDSQ